MTTNITSYLYMQIIDAVTIDTGVQNTMTMFYTPNIRVYRGIDQKIRVQFMNRDQRRVNITGKTISFILIDPTTHSTLLERNLTQVPDPNFHNIGELHIGEYDLVDLDAKYYTYSFKVTDGEGNTYPAYSDDNYSAAGTMEVVDGVYPTFFASTLEDFTNGNTGSAIYITPDVNRNTGLHTAQVFFTSAFTGTLEIQASLSPVTQNINNNDFHTVETINYTNQTAPQLINFYGNYAAVRFVRSGTELDYILYRP